MDFCCIGLEFVAGSNGVIHKEVWKMVLKKRSERYGVELDSGNLKRECGGGKWSDNVVRCVGGTDVDAFPLNNYIYKSRFYSKKKTKFAFLVPKSLRNLTKEPSTI